MLFCQPVWLLIGLSQFGRFLDPLDKVAHIWHLFALLVVPLRQAEIFVHLDDVAGLLILEKEGIWEEYLAA